MVHLSEMSGCWTIPQQEAARAGEANHRFDQRPEEVQEEDLVAPDQDLVRQLAWERSTLAAERKRCHQPLECHHRLVLLLARLRLALRSQSQSTWLLPGHDAPT